ncbi:MAG: molybdenum cofactor guanylyltransferase [Promethearchaeia archaeon]
MVNSNKKDREPVFLVLAGGKSRRFGREDKGIFKFKGKPLIEYQLQTLRKFGRRIFISTKSEEQKQKYKYNLEKTEDLTFFLDKNDLNMESEIRTPLIGIYSTFQRLKELDVKSAFTLSCDSPLIHPDVIALMIEKSESADLVIPQWENGFLEPLFAIYPVEHSIPIAKKNLLEGNFKLIRLLNSALKIRCVSVEKEIQKLDKDLQTFLNVNEKTDLEKLDSLL